jgi:hypothetical protein
MLLFNRRPRHDYVREIGVTCYQLTPSDRNQVSLLEEVNRENWLTEAVDQINQQYGEFTVTFASSYPSRRVVRQKIPFGTTRYFELLCRSS